jgi:hypothetical protein
MPDERIISRIRKLMELADASKNDNTQEVEQAAIKALELLERHNLEMFDVLASESDEGEIIRYAFSIAERRNEQKTWKRYLIYAIAATGFCRAFEDPKDATRIILIGRATDCQVVAELFNTLARRMILIGVADRELAVALGHAEGGAAGPRNPKTWFNSFLIGAAVAVGERLYIMKAEREVVRSDSKALMVLTDEKINDYIEEKMRILPGGRAPQNKHVNQEAVQRGMRAGQQLNLDIEKELPE